MYRRIFALILTFVMVFSMLPGTAVAAQEAATEPVVTEPQATEPKATEPKATEPQATEPKETEPQVTEPQATEPASSQKTKISNPGKEKATEKTTITVRPSFEFPEDGRLKLRDIGSITVRLERPSGEDWETYDEKEISDDNDWTAVFELEEGGTYQIYFDGLDVNNYVHGSKPR